MIFESEINPILLHTEGLVQTEFTRTVGRGVQKVLVQGVGSWSKKAQTSIRNWLC